MRKLLLQIAFLVFAYNVSATPVTNITASYKNGQVFVLWTNLTSLGVQYNLYRSTVPITSAQQLANAQNLGWVPDSSSTNKRITKLSNGVLNFLEIDSLGQPLTLSQGLFVATTTANGSYYYAITTTINGIEDTTIVGGQNATLTPLSETVAMPKPILQRTRQALGDRLFYYVQFVTNVTSTIYPRMTTYGSVPVNFSLVQTQGAAPHPLKVKLHGGASNFLSDTVGSEIISDVYNLGLDDWYPGGTGTAWIGYNQKDNMIVGKTFPPSSGEDLLLTNRRVLYTIQWALKHFPLDSNKVIMYGPSEGGIGTIFTTAIMPDKLSATYEYVGMFNLGFSSDPDGNTAMDTGGFQRKTMDFIFGTVPNNLLDDEGQHLYDHTNACVMAHINRDANYPVMFGINGKNDEMVGWYEKIAFYDSANANRLGGFFYWDMRTHGGGSKVWAFNPPFTKYSTAVSYPAFSNCSGNNNPGDGGVNSGDSVGTINGILDWKSTLLDSATSWQVSLYVRKDIKYKYGSFHTPDSCFVDITPRRTQKFKPVHGAQVAYQNIHNGKIVQSGFAFYDGNLIVVPKLEVYSDTNILRLTISKNDVDTQKSIPITATASRLSMCSSTIDTLNAGGASNYVWTANPNYGTTITGIGPSIIVNPTVTTTYTVTGKDINRVSGTASIVITVGAGLSATVTANGSTSICPGSSVQLTASPTNSSLYNYQWYGNKVKLTGATSPTYNASKTGSAYVLMTSKVQKGCLVTSNTIQVSLATPPSASILAIGDTIVCPGDSVKLVVSTGTGYKFMWYVNDTLISGVKGRICYAKRAGMYNCVITNAGGCSKTTPSVSVSTSGCLDARSVTGVGAINGTPYSITIVPNPSNGNFNLSYTSGDKNLTIEVVNVLGQVIYRQNAEAIQGQYQSQLSLPESVVTGCYFMRIVTGDNVVTRRLIVAR